ncbi:MAG: sodium:proton antiporter [Candidatus Promineifilaceae bacterium]|nr:sodium:proton antiporter [Candidatus Promineifilaceae bacterium]
MTENVLIGLTAILVLGVGAQWISWRFRLPSILLLLLAGFVAGPITGFIDPDALLGDLLFPIISASVAVILFEGGLTLRLAELPHVGGVISRLITVGAMVTWAVGAVAARFILGLDWDLSVLLGAVLIVTGPTVIAPLLRQIQPRGQAGTALKWEGILIDPVGAVLAVLVFEAILAGEFSRATGVIISGVLETIVIGVAVSVVAAGIMIFLLRRYLIPDHLENGVILLFVISAFALSDQLHHESGLLTVTLMGVILANQRFVSIKHIMDFKENLQVLLIGTLFILLSARLEPAVMLQSGLGSLLFLAVLIVLGRPLAILLSTLRSALTWKERLFMAWMAPRGIVAAAVASIFSFELVEAGHAGAEQLVPLTFLVIIGTVGFYGLTAGPVARWLELSEEAPQGVLIVGAHPFSRAIAKRLQEEGYRAMLLDTNRENIQQGRMEGLETHYGNAYSEEVLEELDLTGIGRLLAMTSNDEVNALTAIHFPEVFSRAEVYQLPPRSMDQAGIEPAPPPHLTGRFLFGPEMTYDWLMERLRAGWTIRVTQLTEQFDYLDFQRQHEEKAVPLFLCTGKNRLVIYTVDYQPIPRPGQTLISFVKAHPQGEEEAARAEPALSVPVAP